MTDMIYSFTKNDVDGGNSNIVRGQLSIANLDEQVLFDFGETYSFASNMFSECLNRGKDN